MEFGTVSKGPAVGLLLLSAAQIVAYGIVTAYANVKSTTGDFVYFTDVHVMVFVGFGFLMSFVRNTGLTATSHAFVVAAYAGIWGILCRAFWTRVFSESHPWVSERLSTKSLFTGDFTAAAVLISMGAVLGRVTLPQLLVMAIIQVVFYAVNAAALEFGLAITDAGGGYFIHMFGCYFGLVASWVFAKLTRAKGEEAAGKARYTAVVSTHLSDTLSMIGTLFLFVYWPSFNAAVLSESIRDRAIVNTYLSIAMSVIWSVLLWVILEPKGKITMSLVQNGTLAGGVAISAAAGLVVNPVGAMIVGAFAGLTSVVGFKWITPALSNVLSIHDTRGIHNLHGIPALVGAVVAAIAVGAVRLSSYHGTYNESVLDSSRAFSVNAGFQIVGIFVTLGFALAGGLLAGVAMALLPGLPTPNDDKHEFNINAECEA